MKQFLTFFSFLTKTLFSKHEGKPIIYFVVQSEESQEVPVRARAGSASISRKHLETEEATRPSSLNKTKTAPAQQPEAKPNPDDQKSSGRKSILDTISEDRKAFMEKDAAVQKSIASREEKIQQLKEKSLKKEDDLSAKTLELMELRERTRRMMEKARAKEAEFKENEKKLESVLTQDPATKRSRMDKILARANEKAAQLMAQKQQARQRQEAGGGGEDNLLAFLRSSHKQGRNIYDYIAPVKEQESGAHVEQTSDPLPGSPAGFGGVSMPMEDRHMIATEGSRQNGWLEEKDGAGRQPVSLAEERCQGSEVKQPTQEPADKNRRQAGGQSLGNKFMTMYRDFSDSVQNLTSPKQDRQNSSAPAAAAFYIGDEKSSSSMEMDSYGAWSSQLEHTIHSMEERTHTAAVSNGESRDDNEDDEDVPPKFCSADNYGHYAERWSLSPPQERQSRVASPRPLAQSTSKLRPLNKPAIIVNGRLRTKDNTSETKVQRNSGTTPPYGALVRRKSLSDNCLTAKSQQQRQRCQTMDRELDAFGIPRLPPRPRRSVSLMRETFTNRREEPLPQQQNAEKQRAISHETRTSSAAEFKSLFEAGSAGNSTRASRSSTPFRPPQVCITKYS